MQEVSEELKRQGLMTPAVQEPRRQPKNQRKQPATVRATSAAGALASKAAITPTTAASAAAPAPVASPKEVRSKKAPTSAPPDEYDPLLLHTSTICVRWPCGGEDEELQGVVLYRSADSRIKASGVKGRTKYFIKFKGREPAAGVRTSWNRLKARGYKVISAGDYDVYKRRGWTDCERAAVSRRWKAKEAHASIAKSMFRSTSAVTEQLQRQTNKSYTQKAGGYTGRDGTDIGWRYVIADAMLKLNCRATLRRICEQIEKDIASKLTPKLLEKAHGGIVQRWKRLVTNSLSSCAEFKRTGETSIEQYRLGESSYTRRQHIWQYIPEHAPEQNLGDDKQQRRQYKRKWLNAKDRKAGYDNVTMKT
mmetsp:Transcript_34341/g.56873  ORF Transcript_34341/g.56873 Transcript_34341/m.56873 type:complete len:364 (+) Transcript_34341:129-1220(+)